MDTREIQAGRSSMGKQFDASFDATHIYKINS